MDSARWERIQGLFHRAAELPVAEQRDFLESSCGGDAALVSDVLGLLQEDARGTSLLDRSIAQAAQQVFDSRLPLTGHAIGPYQIKHLLGEGGMGAVYLAEREDLGSVVAIKLLRDAWLSPARRERFLSEQRTLAHLNHPSIARLYDADTLPDGTSWFVMEYVDGVPLTEYCRRNQCSIRERLQLFRVVCEAVQHAHGQAVIHRDLKPSNILVKPGGEVRLLDFGIAKQLHDLEVPADQTSTLMRFLTPAYAAPEQVRGERVGVQTDVYSLGVILYELLTGRLPFDLAHCTASEVENILTSKEPERPSLASSRLGGQGQERTSWSDLDVLCLTAMHKDPQRRYRSVEALIRDLDHFLKQEPLEARPDSLRYRGGKFVRRNSRPIAVAALTLAMVVGLVAFFTARLARARNAAVAEAAHTQRIQRFMMNLFEGGDATVGPKEDLRVVSVVERGVREAQGLSADPREQAELYLTLGSIYQKLGKFDRADSLLQTSLAQRKMQFGADTPEVAEGLIALGILRDAQAQYEEAERLVRQGLEISRRKLPPDHSAIAKATFALGQVLEDRGAYDQSIKVLEEAIPLQSQPGMPPADLAASLTELANSHFYAGHYDVSDSLNRRVLAMHRQLYGERHPKVADDLINLGAIQFQWGNCVEAERFQREALEIIRSWYGPSHPETASALTLVARALVAQDRNQEAAELLHQALAIQEQVYGPTHPRVASALNELGRVAQKRGDLDAAAADFQRMADIYRAVYADKHYLIGVALSNLGGVYLEKKQPERAEALFRETLRRYADTLPANHQNVGIARIRLGRALLAERRYAEAETESRAGYELLSKQASPALWLQTARKDLAAEYEALGRTEEAKRFRAELSAAEKPVKVAGGR